MKNSFRRDGRGNYILRVCCAWGFDFHRIIEEGFFFFSLSLSSPRAAAVFRQDVVKSVIAVFLESLC